MTPIVLARPSPERFAVSQAVVHVFDAVQAAPDGMVTALCGFEGHYTLLQVIPALSGMGCELCVARAPQESLAGNEDPAPLPAPQDEHGGEYAIGLRGERVWHEIAERPVRTVYEGRDVVLTDCGRIGFVMRGQQISGYERCPECRQ